MFPAFHCGSCSFKFLQRSHVAISSGEDGDALVGGSLGWVFEHHWMGIHVLPPVASPRCLLEVGGEVLQGLQGSCLCGGVYGEEIGVE